MTYRISELNQRVTLKREALSTDDMGGSVTTWNDLATLWALVRPMSGREREHSDRVNAESNYLVVIRYRADIRESDKFTWKGIDLNIRFIKDRGSRPLFLEIEVQRGVAP